MNIYTYIMKHKTFGDKPEVKNVEKYYVGKTNNISRKMLEHKSDRWCNYQLIISINGDYEKRIKKFGVNQFIICIKSIINTGG